MKIQALSAPAPSWSPPALPAILPPRPGHAGGAGRALLRAAEEHATIALQPIAEAHTGALYGVEALLRGFDRMGFDSPPALLDQAAALGVLPALERLVNARAVAAFAALPEAGERRLFLNVDSRTLMAETEAGLAGHALDLLAAAGLPADCLCLELSERHELSQAAGFLATQRLRAARGIRLAADDFGEGMSRLRLVFEGMLDYVKVDRFFCAGIGRDHRRRAFARQITDFAHLIGMRVVAEGVEDEADFLGCREVGFDFVQGWFVSRPQASPDAIQPVYPHLAEAAGRERRQRREEGDRALIRGAVQQLPAVAEEADIETVFDLFRRSTELAVVPVVDRSGAPRGVVRERDLRTLIYGRFGRDLLMNRNSRRTAGSFAVPCPVAPVGADAEALLRIFGSTQGGCDGVLLHEGQRYAGFVSAGALVGLLHESRLRQALDQNPLTRLPGNLSVAAHAAEAAVRAETSRHLCYFDFDHFKPFNDHFGFRVGDRAIILFAEALSRHLPASEGIFLGHVGGDDFFAGLRGFGRAAALARLEALRADFAASMAGFFTPAEREQGGFAGHDRDGTPRVFPLLRCSVAVLEIPAGSAAYDPDRLLAKVARLKGAAKASAEGLCLHVVGMSPPLLNPGSG